MTPQPRGDGSARIPDAQAVVGGWRAGDSDAKRGAAAVEAKGKPVEVRMPVLRAQIVADAERPGFSGWRRGDATRAGGYERPLIRWRADRDRRRGARGRSRGQGAGAMVSYPCTARRLVTSARRGTPAMGPIVASVGADASSRSAALRTAAASTASILPTVS